MRKRNIRGVDTVKSKCAWDYNMAMWWGGFEGSEALTLFARKEKLKMVHMGI
jgi:hypothetical protein